MLQCLLGLIPFGFYDILPSPGTLPPGTLETSEQHVRLRVIKKKKIIVKKRKKLRQPGPSATARPLVTTNPAKTLPVPEKQEPGIALPGVLPSIGSRSGSSPEQLWSPSI